MSFIQDTIASLQQVAADEAADEFAHVRDPKLRRALVKDAVRTRVIDVLKQPIYFEHPDPERGPVLEDVRDISLAFEGKLEDHMPVPELTPAEQRLVDDYRDVTEEDRFLRAILRGEYDDL